jgi:uncharacterized protein (DUF2336 family)
MAHHAINLAPGGLANMSVLLLPELDQVLDHGSAPRRAEALLGIATLFRENAARLNSDKIDLFAQVFHRLLDRVDQTALIELARALAPVGKAPAAILVRLAMHNDIAVARPVLEQSGALEPADLANIARQKSQAHLLAIAAREGIGEAVADILMRRGNHEVLRTVARNVTARISAEGFAVLIEAARSDKPLASLLASRPDFPPELFRELLLRADETVREHLLGDSAPVQPALRKIVEEFVVKPAPPDYAAAEARVLALREGGLLNEDKVVELAANARRDDLVAAIALLCAVPIEVVDRIMGADRLDPILIICKSAGWGWQTVRALATALPKAGSISGQALDMAYTNFERLSATTAQRVMRFWQVQHWQPTSVQR